MILQQRYLAHFVGPKDGVPLYALGCPGSGSGPAAFSVVRAACAGAVPGARRRRAPLRLCDLRIPAHRPLPDALRGHDGDRDAGLCDQLLSRGFERLVGVQWFVG